MYGRAVKPFWGLLLFVGIAGVLFAQSLQPVPAF